MLVPFPPATMVDISPRPAAPSFPSPIRRSAFCVSSTTPRRPSTPVPYTPPRRSQSSPPSMSVLHEIRPPCISPPANVLACDFLVIVKHYLAEDYGYYVTEDRGFQSIIENLASRPDLQVPASFSNLDMAFKSIFSDELCNELKNYYCSLQFCPECDGPGFGGLELGSICINIFDELYSTAALLKRLAYDAKEPTLSGEGTPQGGDAPHTNGGRGRGRGGGRGGRGGGRGGRGGGGGGGNANGGGGGGIPQISPPRPANRFTQLPVTFISVPPRTTPQRRIGISQWREACHSQALRFADAVETTSFDLPKFMYTGAADEVVASGDGTLYHATRHSKYRSFARRGIDPPIETSNYFSPALSFNLTDSIEQAVSHVLHGNPSFRIAVSNKPVNPIMVLAFRLEISSIVGAEGTDYVSMGAPGGILNEADANWITGNRKMNGHADLETISKHWIIGPFLTLIDDTTYRIGDRWTRSGRTPVHVAAVSPAAFEKLNSSIVAIFVEKEDRPDEAT